jgi:Domain of unknown function (DUF6265)
MAQTNMQKLEWIVESWVSSSGETNSYEHWEKISDELFTGGSETVKSGDTLFSEKLKIVKEGEEIFYVADVSHNPMPVKFRLTSISDTMAVFENPEHDFPQKISYNYTDGDLHATIEGPGKNGSWKKVDFIMKKMR